MARLLKAAEIGTDGAMTLPGRFYASPEIFEQEQERIFLQRWLCTGRDERIPASGDFFVRNIGTESVIVLRDQGGAVRAFHNVCRHRGTRICEEGQGRFTTGNIRCPYHAWTYALDGCLLGASSMKGLPGFDTGDYPLLPVAVTTWEGFLFLNLAAQPEPFDHTHAPLIGKFGRYNLPTLKAVRRIDYDVQANWKLLFENYSECYHCAPIHPALVRLSPSNSGENDLTRGPFLGGFMAVSPSYNSLTMSGGACAIPVGPLPEEDMRRVYYYSLFPNMLLSLHPDYVMAHTFWPVAPGRTRIECEWLFHPDAAAHPGFAPDDGAAFWDQVNREDWHACEMSQLGVASRAYIPGPYSPRESLSAAFDREYLRALESLSAAFDREYLRALGTEEEAIHLVPSAPPHTILSPKGSDR